MCKPFFIFYFVLKKMIAISYKNSDIIFTIKELSCTINSKRLSRFFCSVSMENAYITEFVTNKERT